MKLITLNPFRTLGIPNITYIKPENIFKEIDKIKEADYVLFPEYWQVNLLVHGLKKNIFPNVSTYQLGHTKVETTRALWATFPENVPYTQILSIDRFKLEDIEEEFGYPLVAKEIKNSMGKGVFEIKNRVNLIEYLNNNETLYLQERLPIDRDLRIVYVGDKVIGAYWRKAQDGKFHNNIAMGGTYDFSNIPKQAIELVEKVAETMGINHAGFDIAVVGDKYYILEFNVLFGNEGLRSLGVKVEDVIYKYIISQYDPDEPTFPDINRRVS